MPFLGTRPGPDAKTDVYGYLLGTVQQNGEIDFKFQQVAESTFPAKYVNSILR